MLYLLESFNFKKLYIFVHNLQTVKLDDQKKL